MHDTAEPSIGALSLFDVLRAMRGFFLSRVLAALMVALSKNSYAFLQEKHKLGRSSPDPRLSSYPWASTKVRDNYELCSGRGQVSSAPRGSY